MGRPVVLWVDCYELPIRKDTFRKKHLPHTILVHGYNDCTGHFHIIEHLQMENLSYDKKQFGWKIWSGLILNLIMNSIKDK